MLRLLRTTILSLFLAGCAQPEQTAHTPPDVTWRFTGPDAFSLEKLPICHGYGCREQTAIAIPKKTWKTLTKPLRRNIPNAGQERARLAQTLQNIEQYVGKETGTDQDIAGSFTGTFASGQTDCVDEAHNASLYLALLERHKLMKFHRFSGISARGFFLNGWPHQAPFIETLKSQERYIVDSWFEDHGHPPHIVPLALWQDGWSPPEPPSLPAN